MTGWYVACSTSGTFMYFVHVRCSSDCHGFTCTSIQINEASQQNTHLRLNMWLSSIIDTNHISPPLPGLLMDASTYSAMLL